MSLDYETDNGVGIVTAAQITMTHFPTGGWDGGGCYGMAFDSVVSEFNGGWTGPTDIPIDSSDDIFVSYMLKMSQVCADALSARDAGTNGLSKFLQFYYWTAAGDPGSAANEHRIVHKLASSVEGLDHIPESERPYPSMPTVAAYALLKGGAGRDMTLQSIPYNDSFDIAAFGGAWFYAKHVIDTTNQVMRVYVKTQSGAFTTLTKIYERPFTWPWATDLFGNPVTDEDITPITRGFNSMLLGNFWGSITSAIVGNGTHIWVDRFRVEDGWSNPPF